MCTVTVVPHADGVRLLFNRDEQRTRLPGLPPRIHRLSGRRAMFPVDPEGGGTWVGANDVGLIVALLNLRPTLPTASSAPKESRGLIVLDLLRCRSVSLAMTAAMALDAERFQPFRVVVVHAGALAVATSRGAGPVECTRRPLDAPALFTSSSLGDTVVGPPRQRLFRRMVLQAPGGWLAGQARFHDHQWPRRPEISVRMERQDALTVSRTRIDVTNDRRVCCTKLP